ncbi:hypothetical protein A2U01_0115262, partial [Trifolium medium]|nr:hypothetical protein [Trifolium medium]
MAIASHNRDDDDDTVPRSPPREFDPVLTLVGNNQDQTPVDNTGDPRDGR